MMPSMRRYLPFVPSALTGLVGAVWLLLRPFELPARAGPGAILLTATLLTLLLLGAAWLLERTLPSFRFASALLERALASYGFSRLEALALATLTATAEELFFRGALLPVLGVWGQALVFGLLHPMPKRGWSYPLYTFVAGAAFGYAVLVTGSLWTSLLAHFAVNLWGLLTVSRRVRASG
ncbi:Abortive infection protein [Truepera radiovictrix DSM 17093]|uniref:Abortive infection protein n=2 Tax=Truepera TaxID=332248 RepID=D7CTX5_TRURR|nr:Abortive infection protein [Truepera radiovictrix DSM 17093]